MPSIVLDGKEKPNPNFIPPATKKVKEEKMVLFNIPMPPRCLECPCIAFKQFVGGAYCNANEIYHDLKLPEKLYLYTRPDWCPMKEVTND